MISSDALESASCDITHETGGTICYGIGFCVLGYHTRDRGYDWLRALGSASGDITHETGATSLVISRTRQEATICYGHWVLRLVISHTRQEVRFVTGIDSASCDFTQEPGGTICYVHWVLRFVTSHTKEGVRVVAVKKFCILCYFTRHKGYDMLRALASASCDITHETGSTICYWHWDLRLVRSPIRQWVFCFGLCVLRLC